MRPNVTTDTDGINTGNSIWVNGVSIGANSETRNLAVFLLYDAAAIPLLLRVAKTHQNLAVRKQAIFWLGQSGDERALAFFKEIFAK